MITLTPTETENTNHLLVMIQVLKANAKQNASFAKAHGLLAVTADVTLVDPAFAAAFADAGVPLYVHTVNDAETQSALRTMGVSGVYTDFAE